MESANGMLKYQTWVCLMMESGASVHVHNMHSTGDQKFAVIGHLASKSVWMVAIG